MLQKLTFVFSIFLLTISASAQVKKFKYGDVSIQELEMNIYEQDSGASAIYLIDYGDVEFKESDFSMEMDVHVRIKILNEDGLNYGDLEFNYIRGSSEFRKLKAAVYNLEDGKVVQREVSKRDWIDERVVDRRFTKKISLPGVKVGSVIEYSYRRTNGNIASLPGWVFQAEIPVVYSEYKIQTPQYGSYQPNFQGYVQPKLRKTAGGNYHIVMHDVPALKEEPHVSTIENFRSKIDFEIKSFSAPGYGTEVFMENWPAINEDLLEEERFGKILNRKNAVRRIYPDEKGWKADKESMIEIYNYVRDHFKWNGYGDYRVVDSGKELWKAAEGDNADINFTLAQFLRQAGIEAHPVILSTRGNGYVNQYIPLINQFNYVVICASFGEERYLMDATSKTRPFNVLPSHAINGNGLMITPYGPQWIDLRTNKEINSKTVSVNYELNEDLELEGDVQLVFRSAAAADMRSTLVEERDKGNDIEDPEEGPLKRYAIGEVDEIEVLGLEEAENPLEVRYEYFMEDRADQVGGEIYINPLMFKETSENPFKLEERLYPVEFAEPISNTYVFNLTLPEGYEVTNLPKSENVTLPNGGGKYMFNVMQQENKVTVMVRFFLAKTQYGTDEYQYLKLFYNKILEKQDLSIVLKEVTD